MSTVLLLVVFIISLKHVAYGFPDLKAEAVTVYRNPKFFSNLNQGARNEYSQKPSQTFEGHKKYKYPSEVHKTNSFPSPGFEVNYDSSPEFHHEPRDIFVNTAHKPTRKKGPYTPRYNSGSPKELRKPNVTIPVQETGGDIEDNRESKGNADNDPVEEPRDFVSAFNENSYEDFKSYHEPILLARPYFDPTQNTGARSTYNQPYHYNRTAPVLYEDWKFYTYPKIHANEHLKSESKIYSEEPPSNSFEDELSFYHRYEDETENPPVLFESNNFKNLGADTKHIYKKLLKPKKSFLLKINSKPKFKKLKFHFKKKHPHKTDWFDEYPFDF